MLVLSRRAEERIVFPSIGVTVHLLRIKGNVARIGIEAPPELRVLRHELELPGSESAPLPTRLNPPPATAPLAPAPAGNSPTHELCNRLSKVTLALHLFQRQREAGMQAEAEASLGRVFAALENLDRDSVATLLRADAPPPPPRVPRVLLVEDDFNERELLAGLLDMNGCECATAGDGVEALEYLDSHTPPDVVLLDMQMPRCDGPATLRAIRSVPRLSGVKVFSVSSTAPQQIGVPIGSGGIDGWYPKPLNPRVLCRGIAESVLPPSARN